MVITELLLIAAMCLISALWQLHIKRLNMRRKASLQALNYALSAAHQQAQLQNNQIGGWQPSGLGKFPY